MLLGRLCLLGALLTLTTTASAAEPHVASTAPPRLSFAAAATTVAITFDQPLLPASITSSSVRVFGRATGTASGPLVLSNTNHTVTLTPSRPFSAGETVYVNLSHDLRASDSTPLRAAGYAFQFTVQTQPATRVFQQIDSMSNRIAGAQTRIYGALQADLDHDGWIDLATVNEVSADLRVFMNRADGSGLYHPFLQPPYAIGLEASPNEPADFDNDGNIDMVVSATDGFGVWIAHGNGDGTFGGTQSITTGSEPHGVAVLDVDGDGDFDIVDAVEGDDRLALMINDGSGVFGAPTFFDSGCSGEWALGQADMNNDGIFDLVAGCVNDWQAAVLLGNGNGTFTAVAPQNAGGAPWQVALGDVDGNGTIDAAFANSFSNNGGLLRGNGDGTFGALVTVPVPGHTPASDLGDLDGDGDLDWVLSSYGAGLWRIYANDGAGTFVFDQDIAAPSNPSCAVMLDFDNDGDLDLALSDEIADLVGLWQNQNPLSPLCPASPAVCRTPIATGKAKIAIKDKTPNQGDQLVWRWGAGPTTPKADYGNPLTSDDYTLCVYDAGILRTSPTAPAGGTCKGAPCWKDAASGFSFKSTAGSSTGVRRLKLKEGLAPGQAKITVVAKGTTLSVPNLGALTGPVTVQLHRSGGGPCFGATYSAPFRSHDATRFDDTSD